MATVLRFPTERLLHDPELRALRIRFGPLSPDESVGLRALDAGDCDDESLREYLAGDIDGDTWRAWLRAFGRLAAQAPREH